MNHYQIKKIQINIPDPGGSIGYRINHVGAALHKKALQAGIDLQEKTKTTSVKEDKETKARYLGMKGGVHRYSVRGLVKEG